MDEYLSRVLDEMNEELALIKPFVDCRKEPKLYVCENNKLCILVCDEEKCVDISGYVEKKDEKDAKLLLIRKIEWLLRDVVDKHIDFDMLSTEYRELVVDLHRMLEDYGCVIEVNENNGRLFIKAYYDGRVILDASYDCRLNHVDGYFAGLKVARFGLEKIVEKLYGIDCGV